MEFLETYPVVEGIDVVIVAEDEGFAVKRTDQLTETLEVFDDRRSAEDAAGMIAADLAWALS